TRQRASYCGHQVRRNDGRQHDPDGRCDFERIAEAARVTARTVGWAKRSVPTNLVADAERKMVGTAQTRLCPPYIFKSIQRNTLRVAAEIRRRAERLAVDRAIEVLARERRFPSPGGNA